MSKKLLIKSLKDATVIKKGDYKYLVHPITDGIPQVDPELINEICEEMLTQIQNVGAIDKIVTIEAMGVPITTLLSQKMKIPFTIVRKRPYGFKDEISVQQNTGYSKTKLYINGIKKSDKIIIVDDILSTGGTLEAILISFQKIGVNIKGIFVVIDKGNSIDVIRNKYSIIIKSLIRVSIKNEKMTIKN